MKIEMIEKKFPQHFFAQVELSRGSTAPFKNHQGGPDFNKAEKRGIGREKYVRPCVIEAPVEVAPLQSRVEYIPNSVVYP